MSISEELNKIKNAVHGREVRDAIHDGIKKAYDDASQGGNANMEVSLARGNFPTLSDRLNSVDSQLAQKANQDELNTEKGRIDNLIANAGDTDGNAELLDIRVGWDGVIYPTAGDAVRSIQRLMTTEGEPWGVVV